MIRREPSTCMCAPAHSSGTSAIGWAAEWNAWGDQNPNLSPVAAEQRDAAAGAVRAVPALARWPLGEVPASHTGWFQLSPRPTLNHKHCSRTPFSSPIFVPSTPPGEGIKFGLNYKAPISVVGFESLNYYNTSGHALELSCCLTVSCQHGGHVCTSPVKS